MGPSNGGTLTVTAPGPLKRVRFEAKNQVAVAGKPPQLVIQYYDVDSGKLVATVSTRFFCVA